VAASGKRWKSEVCGLLSALPNGSVGQISDMQNAYDDLLSGGMEGLD
jgi:hypothetical protein